jgi:hypothetical protein
MNIFSRSCKRSTTSKKKPSDFKKGEVYRMAVAKWSHVTEPYHVIINDVGSDFIETYIPGKHSLRIEYPSPTWDYQTERMTFVNGDWATTQNTI